MVGRSAGVLRPRKGRFGLVDYEKVFCLRAGQGVFDLCGVDRDRGCVVVVAPDQYVAQVLPPRYARGARRPLAGALVEALPTQSRD